MSELVSKTTLFFSNGESSSSMVSSPTNVRPQIIITDEKNEDSTDIGDWNNPGGLLVPFQSPINSKIADLACKNPKKLAEKILNLQIVAEEKDKVMEELDQQIAFQKSEYESALNRHQNFIDQLIKAKITLRLKS